MISQWYVFGMMFKVILAFMLVFIIIPWKAVRFDLEADRFLDKFFICLIHSTLIIILLAHFLAFLKLYEYFSLVFFLILILILSKYVHVKTWPALAEALGVKTVVFILDASEGRIGLKEQLRQNWLQWVEQRKADLKQFWYQASRDPFFVVLPLIVLLLAAYLRFEHAIFNGTYTVSDTYGHLAWSKRMGMNEIYYYGVYSYGLHSLVSALNKLFFLDAYWICRFIGPLAGALLVLSVYYFTLRITGSKPASLVSAVIYGLVNHPDFPSVFNRQKALLTQEYATFFVLPGLYFLWLYLKSGRKRYLFLYAEALAVAFFIHPFGAFYLALWSAIMFLAAWLPLKIKFRMVLSYGIANLVAVIVPLVALGIGLLMGIELFRSSAAFIQESITTGQGGINLTKFIAIMFEGGWIQDVVLLIALCLTFLSVPLYWLKQRLNAVLIMSITLATLLTFVMYRSKSLQIPTVVDYYRTGTFLALLIPVVYALGILMLSDLIGLIRSSMVIEVRGLITKVMAVSLCIVVLYTYPFVHNVQDSMEYEAAVQNYLVIKRDFPALDWTIVAPTEQLEQVIGISWHSDILRLIQKHTPQEVADPAFKWPIPTSHIFFYTEKIPFRWGKPIGEEDAKKDLEPEGDDPFLQYYHTGHQRAILEAKAIRLMESYRASHNDMTIYYEDEEMRIYYVYQDLKDSDLLEAPITDLLQQSVLRQ